MDLRLEGKVALVTGASKGIGRAIAAAYADSGASVMLSSRKQDSLDAAVAEIGGDTAAFAANAGEIDQATACVEATVERFGSVDILVNNAAANPYMGPTLGIDPGAYDKTFQVNLRGPLFWSKVCHERSMAHHGGKIRELFWTLGGYDGVIVFEAPDADTATAIELSLVRKGNVRSKTLQAFDRAAMLAILGKIS